MVKARVTGDDHPERALVLSYAPAAARGGLATLLALDDRLGAIVRRAGDPTIALMRLTWWAEALAALDTAPPPAEPILAALSAEVLSRGETGGTLAAMVDGWELLLDPEPMDDAGLAAFARARGGTVFAAAARLLGGADDRVAAAGEGWALADLAGHWSDPAAANVARAMAEERLAVALGGRWPVALRPLGALTLLARSDLAGGRQGAPARVGRLLLHRLTGR